MQYFINSNWHLNQLLYFQNTSVWGNKKLLLMQQKAFNFWGACPQSPDSLTRDSVPGPRWEAQPSRPQHIPPMPAISPNLCCVDKTVIMGDEEWHFDMLESGAWVKNGWETLMLSLQQSWYTTEKYTMKCCLRLLCLKSIGVKFKVLVTDNDLGTDDTVDRFVHLLQLTPAPNVSVSNWTTVNMLGTRSRIKTRQAP